MAQESPQCGGREWRRRDVFKAGAAVSLFAAGLGRPAFADGVIQLKASLFVPPANGAAKVVTAWGKTLATKTGGRVNVEVFPSSQMGPPNRQYDLVRDGVADLSWVLHGFTPGRFPLMDIANLPEMFASSAKAMAAIRRVQGPLVAEHSGVKVLGLVTSPQLVIMTRDKAVRKVGDFKGLRVRPPSAVTAGAIQALGGASVAVPPAEMGQALSKGVIDAIVTTAEAAASFRLFEAVKYVTDVNMGMATFAFVMNPAAYARMPDDVKAALDSVSGATFEQQMVDEFDRTDVAARAAAKSAGVEFIAPDTAAAQEFSVTLKGHRQTVVAALVAKGVKSAQSIYQAMQG